MYKYMKFIAESALVLGLALPAAAGAGQATGWTPCAPSGDPGSLWSCWSGGSGEGLLAAACVPKSVCPARDQNGKPVLKCWYESDYKTGWRCILFCDYGGAYPWGSDGGTRCD